MDIEVVEAHDNDRAVARRLLQFYRYDLSEFDGRDVDPHGEYLHRYFDEYRIDSDRRAFLIRVDGAWAGIALVFIGAPRDMAEFFVMRKFRYQGVGTTAANSIFDRYPGLWTVREQLTNPAASAFWRTAIARPFEENMVDGEVVQTFSVGE